MSFMLASLQKTIIYNYFSKIFTRGSEKVHFRIALSSTPSFSEQHPTIASNAKYGVTIRNSAKCLLWYEEMKKCFSFHEKNPTNT